jgi:hypothetical protein
MLAVLIVAVVLTLGRSALALPRIRGSGLLCVQRCSVIEFLVASIVPGSSGSVFAANCTARIVCIFMATLRIFRLSLDVTENRLQVPSG